MYLELCFSPLLGYSSSYHLYLWEAFFTIYDAFTFTHISTHRSGHEYFLRQPIIMIDNFLYHVSHQDIDISEM